MDIMSFFENDMSQLTQEDLQSRLFDLQKRAKHIMTLQQKEARPVFRYQILYRILRKGTGSAIGPSLKQDTLSGPYFDPPEQIQGQGESLNLRCNAPVQNFDLFLERNKDISFIVYRTHVVEQPDSTTPKDTLHNHEVGTRVVESVTESIRPIAQDLIQALQAILEVRNGYADVLQNFRTTMELHAPFLFMYHLRNDHELLQNELKPQAVDHFTLFWHYVLEQYGDTFANASSMISQGSISSAFAEYLYKPGDVLISRSENAYRGWMADSWAVKGRTEHVTRRTAEATIKGGHVPLYSSHGDSRMVADDMVALQHYTIRAWAWDFDGNFQREYGVLDFAIIAEDKPTKLEPQLDPKNPAMYHGTRSEETVVPIRDLMVFPMDHASQEIRDRIRQRGHIFWRCRSQQYVSYCEEEKALQGVVGDPTYLILL